MALVQVFRDDDDGYLKWLEDHPAGYVINTVRSLSSNADRKLHVAGCWTINGHKPGVNPWTAQYAKVCGVTRADLTDWGVENPGRTAQSCGTCSSLANASPVQSRTRRVVSPRMADHARCDKRGPSVDNPVIEAWADEYIRFEKRTPSQEHLRQEIRSRCRQLEPAQGEVLHATLFGPKPGNSDVENLVLYNIEPKGEFCRNGIRFEHGAASPLGPDGTEYAYCYRYALAARAASFTDWRIGGTIASFDWADLESFANDKRLAQVWLALSRRRVTGMNPAAKSAPFAVRLHIRPPRGHKLSVDALLVKSVFDGVISAFQASIDTRDLPEITSRLAEYLDADAAEIAEHLLDQGSAALCAVPRLVFLWGSGVKWNPSDDRCVAGELLAAEPVDDRWAIKGELVEVSR